MTQHSRIRRRVPDLMLERYRLGEMAPDEAAELARRIPEDDDLRRRLDALEASDEEMRRSSVPTLLAARVRQTLERRSGARWAIAWWRPAAALAGALVLAFLFGPPLFRPDEAPADRIKGLDPAILLFRKTASGSEPLQDGAVARPGDLLRIGYRAAGSAWGLILSVDSRGLVTRHLPREGGRAERLSAASQVLLDFAYELDDAPLWERFYFVAGPEPFDVAPVVEAARGVSSASVSGPPPALPLGMKLKQSSLLLVKKAQP